MDFIRFLQEEGSEHHYFRYREVIKYLPQEVSELWAVSQCLLKDGK